MVNAYQAPSTPKEDAEQLGLLSVLFYCYGGFVAFAALALGAIALIPGFILASAPPKDGPPALLVGGILVAVFGLIAFFLLAKAVLLAFAGHALARRRNATLILVAACLSLLTFPLGTALGVFTIMVLQRPSVKALFG
jgi:hypothetical protein